MKSEWVVLLAAFLYVAFLAFAAGAFSYSLAEATTAMPFGAVEFWLERYQTLSVSIFAILGLAGVSVQVSAMKRQTRAGLMQAHKDDLASLALARSAISRLKGHIDTAEKLRRAHGAAVLISPPPLLDHEVTIGLRKALNTAVPDPFGIVDIHDVWKTCSEHVADGTMPVPDFLLFAYDTKAQLDEADRNLSAVIETLHAQIDASV